MSDGSPPASPPDDARSQRAAHARHVDRDPPGTRTRGTSGARSPARRGVDGADPCALRVLVVDDMSAVRAGFVRLLARRGYAVVGEGTSVAQAVMLADRLAPDVVLLDVELPDGLGTAASARITAGGDAGESGARRRPAVVLCTGNPGRVTTADLARAGAFTVLPKPVSTEVLEAAIQGAALHAAWQCHDARESGAAGSGERSSETNDGASAHLVDRLRRLRATIAAHVAERRGGGVPVERLLAEVRTLVREAASCEHATDPSDTLLRCTSQWAAAAYDRAGRPPRRG